MFVFPTPTGGKPINWIRDFVQGCRVSDMRNKIGDVIATCPYGSATLRTELAFFATLPPTVIVHHITVWQMGQHHRQLRRFSQGYMKDGRPGVHEVVARCML